MMQELSLYFLQLAAVYFITINVLYGLLLLLSWLKVQRYENILKKASFPSQLPPVTFVVPAYNEQSLIVETIQTYLSLTLEQKEIIVVNDGSHDKTFKMLQNMFQLKRLDEHSEVFQSILYPDLKVLEAPHLGKAQALNLGVSHAAYDLICTMDADTIPTLRGVKGCLEAFSKEHNLIAAGGVIQVLNSHVLKENAPKSQPKQTYLNIFQSLEYLRTFLCERLGWSLLGSTLLISGAFCMVRKKALQKVGGFRHNSITEDFDLIVRLRKAYPGQENRFRILPLTTCYTQVPKDSKHLMVQRMRWQMGLVDTLSKNMDMLFNLRQGLLGMFAIPYFWMVEVLSPIIELMALVLIPYCLIQNWIEWNDVLFFLLAGIIFNIGVTFMGIYLDNRFVSRNKNWSCMRSAFHTFLLHCGYKQLISWWRFLALLKSFRKKHLWGEKPRQEIIHQNL